MSFNHNWTKGIALAAVIGLSGCAGAPVVAPQPSQGADRQVLSVNSLDPATIQPEQEAAALNDVISKLPPKISAADAEHMLVRLSPNQLAKGFQVQQATDGDQGGGEQAGGGDEGGAEQGGGEGGAVGGGPIGGAVGGGPLAGGAIGGMPGPTGVAVTPPFTQGVTGVPNNDVRSISWTLVGNLAATRMAWSDVGFWGGWCSPYFFNYWTDFCYYPLAGYYMPYYFNGGNWYPYSYLNAGGAWPFLAGAYGAGALTGTYPYFYGAGGGLYPRYYGNRGFGRFGAFGRGAVGALAREHARHNIRQDIRQGVRERSQARQERREARSGK